MDSWLDIAIIACGLGADAFSVSVGVGTCFSDWHSRLRLSAAFGMGQFVMPVVGWTAGAIVLPYVEAYDHWVAAAVLTALSMKMIWESMQEEKCPTRDATRGLLLWGLALAVSIDALAVGFTMGTLPSVRWLYALLIGVVAAAMTLAGTLVGHHGSQKLGAWAERAGALLLLAVAAKIVLL